MDMILPKVMQYGNKYPYLPADSNTSNSSIVPQNGTVFSESAPINFTFPKEGFLVPDSLYIKYKWALTTTSGAGIGICGTPVYSFFRTSEVNCVSNLETIANYGQIMHFLTNVQENPAQKQASASAYGFTDASIDNQNGYAFGAAGAQGSTFSGPLFNILSNCEQLIPLCMMPEVNLILTTDTIARCCSNGVAVTADTFKIFNIELCYQIYNPGSIIKNQIMASFPEIHLKTLGVFSANQSIPTTSSGQLTLNYTAKYGSVKGVALLPSASAVSATVINGSFDNYDITAGAGSYQIYIGSDPYP
jgi:hypothetical protein